MKPAAFRIIVFRPAIIPLYSQSLTSGPGTIDQAGTSSYLHPLTNTFSFSELAPVWHIKSSTYRLISIYTATLLQNLPESASLGAGILAVEIHQALVPKVGGCGWQEFGTEVTTNGFITRGWTVELTTEDKGSIQHVNFDKYAPGWHSKATSPRSLAIDPRTVAKRDGLPLQVTSAIE